MDEQIANWILEFLLRQPIDEKIINGVLSSLPLKTDNNNRLKKTILLRKIESETKSGSISEQILDLIEIIEELDHREGFLASKLMKEAYCKVAVDYTVNKHLEENNTVENHVNFKFKYFETLERVWRERVCKVKSLVSEDSSKRWLGEIVAMVWDNDHNFGVLSISTKDEALKAVRAYLDEAWGSLGPTFLESVAEKFGEGWRGGGGGGDGVVSVGDPCPELVVVEDIQKGPRDERVASKCKCRRGARISDDDEVEDEFMIKSKRHTPMSKEDDLPTPEVGRVPCSAEQNATVTVKINLPDSHQTVQKFSSKATDNDKIVAENQIMNTTPEERTRKALDSSSMEQHVIVKDPITHALQTDQTQTLPSTIETDEKSTSSESMAEENQTGPVLHDMIESSESDSEDADKEDNRAQDARGKEVQDQRELRNLPGRSLMEPNGSSHTIVWDDSIDNLPGGSPIRHCLQRLKRNQPSPLKTPTKKRRRKMWTPEEEETLRKCVLKFGKNWKFILDCYPYVFQKRTSENLKDKWKNMTRQP